MLKLIRSTFYKEKETKKKLAEFIKKADILSMYDECRKFERLFAEKQGRKYALFVSNGSAANLALIQALLNTGKISKGDKVGFSTITWATNVMPLIQLGLEPIPVDCELESLNISVKTIKASYSKDKFKALFVTNVLGFGGELNKIASFCKENKIILIEDNCEALGSKIGSTLLGNFGFASTFSTYVGHHLSTIEGGMVCTDDEEFYHMLCMVRAHGWDRNIPEKARTDLIKKHKIDPFVSKYTFYDLAYNVRPTDIQGFIGNVQINYWDEVVGKRESNYKLYEKTANSNNHLYHYNVPYMSLVSNFTYPLIFKTKVLYRKYRDRFIKHDIEIRPVIAGNITRQPFFKKYISKTYETPVSELVHENGFYIANNPELTKGELELLCSLLKK
ncbi:MAG: DegT/DnrJ/EryC1/StrS family aminotransferase [Patescibacteria group bacterium]